MNKKQKQTLKLLSKKYTYEILNKLQSPRRFKELGDICKIEKMRTQRLKELEKINLIKVTPKRMDGRSISLYEISGKGRKVLKISEELSNILK